MENQYDLLEIQSQSTYGLTSCLSRCDSYHSLWNVDTGAGAGDSLGKKLVLIQRTAHGCDSASVLTALQLSSSSDLSSTLSKVVDCLNGAGGCGGDNCTCVCPGDSDGWEDGTCEISNSFPRLSMTTHTTGVSTRVVVVGPMPM